MKLIRFSAVWCVFCPPVARIVEKLAGEHNLAVEVQDCTGKNAVANRYDIQALPTVLFVNDDGQVLAKVAGAQPRLVFERALEQARAKAAKGTARKAVRKFNKATGLKPIKVSRQRKARRG